MQLEAPTTTTTAQTLARGTDTTNIERPDDDGSSINHHNDKMAMEEDEIGHNSDPTTATYTQPDATNKSTNEGSPGTASYIAKITGYISKTINTNTTTTHTNNNNTTTNNTMNIQYIYVNNRPVDLPKINRLLNEIWLKYTLKSHTNISYILNIYLPTYTYDINMSPNKREIVLLYEIDILNWMRITINRLYSETTHGIFLMNNNSLINNSDNMLNNTSSNKNDIQKVSTNKSSYASTTNTTTDDAAGINTSAAIVSSTIQQQSTSCTSQPTAEYPMDENNRLNLSSSQTTIQNFDCDDKSGVNFGVISPYIPRLTQSTVRGSVSGGCDVITSTDLTHLRDLTHIDLIHDIDREYKQEYNNNHNGEYDCDNNIEEEEAEDDVYTNNSNNNDVSSSSNDILYTELPSSSSSVVWMEEPEVIIMTPSITHTQPTGCQIDSEPVTDNTAVIHPSADETGTYTSGNSSDNNKVGEKRKHTYNNTDDNNNTTANKSIKLNDNNIPTPASSSFSSYTGYPSTREIWSNYPSTSTNNNNSDSYNYTSYTTNNILESCTNDATSLLHYIHTHTNHTLTNAHTNNTNLSSNTGYTHSHFSTLDFWFPDTTTTATTMTDHLYNKNEAYTSNNTVTIATGTTTDSVVADIMALFSATSPATTDTTAATATATTTNSTSSNIDLTRLFEDDEQGPATSEEGVTAATSEEDVTAATSEEDVTAATSEEGVTAATSEEGVTAESTSVVEEPLYTLKTISKEVCVNFMCA